MSDNREVESWYSKKTKPILIQDCVYLDRERNLWRDTANRHEKDAKKLAFDLDKARRKNAVLQDSLKKLVEVIGILKDEVGIL